MMKERADDLLVRRGLADSRQKAQALIMAGEVFSGGKRVEKSGQQISMEEEIDVRAGLPFVSRGGMKLAEALDVFEVNVAGEIAADLGASTGGFTDCLLQRKAKRVYAVDVDTRQLDWGLRGDPRVIMIEKNARNLDMADFADPPRIITMDLSFISVLKVIPAVKTVFDQSQGLLLCLIKPQFEAARGCVGKGGVIRSPERHEEILFSVVSKAWDLGFCLTGLMKTSVRGQKGNQEFFVRWSIGESKMDPDHLKNSIREVVRNEKSQ